MDARFLIRSLRGAANLQPAIQRFDGARGKYRLRGAPNAHHNIHSCAGHCREQRADDKAARVEFDARARLAQFVDQFFVARFIQHEDSQIGDFATQGFGDASQIFCWA